MKRIMLSLLTFLFFFSSLARAADAPVGSISTLKGKATIIREKKAVETKVGSRVFQKDSLRTGTDGSVAVVFKDDTLLSIGPNSEVVIKEFLYSPAEGKLSIITRLIRGTSAYLSGIIGKLSPESVRYETPVADIGIRGTKFAVAVEGPVEEDH